MKKTTKILLLVLSFVLVFTVSAVVSFAAEDKDWGDVKVLQEFDFETVADEYFHNGDESFDNAVVEGASFVFAKYLDNGHRTGFVRSIVSYDGNTAVAYEYSETPNKLDSYLYVKLGDAPTKSGGNSMANNAYYVIDWDMYSPTGFYGEKAGPAFKFIFTRYDASGTTKYDKLNNVTFSQIKTDKNGNTTINGVTLDSSSQWQHYTVILEIVKQYDETGNLLYNINGHLFVDGVFVQTLPGMLSDLTAADFFTVDGEIKTSLINLTEMRFEFIRTGKNTTETKPADRERATRSIAFDNYSARSFSKYYADVEQIASVVNGSKNLTEWKDTKFTADYNHPFGQLVATVTAPDGTTSYYDNARDAFAGAAAGSVVDLYKDVESATINSAVLVNTNGYDFNFSSSRYSATIIENTVEGETVKSYKFSRSQNSELAVYWDIDGENNLFAITTSILGTVPTYPRDLSNYIVYEYAADDTAKERPLSAKELVGWAYSKDATKPDNIGKVTVWDIESSNGAWIALYPVFEQLAIRVIDAEGNISFYSNLGDAISASPAGATVELGMDLELTDGFSVSKELTVDLNGHRIILNSNDVVNTKKENGSIGYGTKPALFKVPEGVKFSITSSLPGAEIFVSACVAQLNFDGTPFDVPKIMGSSVVYLSGSGAKDVDITVNGENLTVYASTLVAEWSSNLHGLVTINGGNYYRTVNDLQGFINPRGTNYIDYVVNDAFLCAANGKGAIMSDSGAATTAGNPYTITFNNCVFYKPDAVAGIVNKDADCSVYINNSVICTKITESVGKIVLGEGTIYNDTDIEFNGTNIVIDSVCQAFSKETPVTISYAFNQFAYSKDDETGKGEMLPSSYEIPEVTNNEIKFNTWLAGPNNSLIIKWLAPDGVTVLAEGIGLPGYIATPPAIDMYVEWVDGDGWRDLKVTEWENPNGENDLFVPDGTTGEYVFKAVMPSAEDPDVKFVASPKKIKWNITLGSNIGIIFYIPADEGVEINSVKVGTTALTVSNTTVSVGDVDYYTATLTVDATNAHVAYSATITYTIDGVEYIGELAAVSALEYVQGIIAGDTLSAYQKTSIADMMRYISELYKKSEGSVPEEYAKFVEDYADILTPYEYDSETRYTLSTEQKKYISKIDVDVKDGKPVLLIYWTSAAKSAYKKDNFVRISVVNASGLSNNGSGALVDSSYSIVYIDDSSCLGASFKIRVKGKKELTGIADCEYSFVSMILDNKDAGRDVGLAEALYALEKTKNNPPEGEEAVVFPITTVLPKRNEE